MSKGKSRWHKRVSNPGSLNPESYALPLRHTGWLGLGMPTLFDYPTRISEANFMTDFFTGKNRNKMNCFRKSYWAILISYFEYIGEQNREKATAPLFRIWKYIMDSGFFPIFSAKSPIENRQCGIYLIRHSLVRNTSTVHRRVKI